MRYSNTDRIFLITELFLEFITFKNFFRDFDVINLLVCLGAVRKLRKHIGVLSWSEKVNFCLFLVLKRGT